MSDAKFDGADMSEVVMSKAYAVGASFKGNISLSLHPCNSLCRNVNQLEQHADGAQVLFELVNFGKK